MALSLLKYSDRVFFKVSIVFFNFRVCFLSVVVLQTQTHFPQGLIKFNQSNHTCSLRKHGYGLIYCGLCYCLVTEVLTFYLQAGLRPSSIKPCEQNYAY